ncbi:sensor histidine kinase [Agromyces aurantiacus]|uniref:histidine kinase n=1 Tax=Agromyces aurantiacus TaxID=165814 RepID=A0ABV9R8E1_9MICO|nr:histidine kinase [Agromyces aurantiacus]MBM7505256.1 signal transduction histidine kinase [Agromyces aurantiacus]
MAGRARTIGRATSPADADAAPGRVRRLAAERPWLVDAAVSLVFTVIVVTTLASEVIAGDAEVTPWQVVSIAGTAIALLFRRRAPVVVLVVVTLLTTVLGFSAESNLVLAVPIALYAVAAFRSPTAGWIAGTAAFAATAASLFLWLPELEARLGEPGAFDIPVVLLTIGMADAVGVLLGANTWQRAERVRVLTERADQLARERDDRARIATLAERSRIAREMHDIVAHSLSVMITLADGAATAVDRDPAGARRALDRLADTGRDALRDMRQVLSVLGEDADEGAASLEPAPGREDLDELVARFREAGLPVRFTVRGAPSADPQRDLAVYRIVQEALTNALRYATDVRRVDVTLQAAGDATIVTVVDDGRAGAPAVGAGRGLIGMSERAAVFGGSVETGPTSAGGWRVRAVIPNAEDGVARAGVDRA